MVFVFMVVFVVVLETMLFDDPSVSVQHSSLVVGNDSLPINFVLPLPPPVTVAEAKKLILSYETWRAGVVGEGVPFYIYDKEDGVSWTDDLDRITNTSVCVDQPVSFAYMGEVWFLNQLRSSPWRTWNSSAAIIVVLPLFMHVAESEQCTYTEKDAKDVYEIIRSTELFQRREEDHLLVWTSPVSLVREGRLVRPNKFRGNIGVMENLGRRATIVAPFSSVGPDRVSGTYLNGTRSLLTIFGGRSDDSGRPGFYIRQSLAHQWQNISEIMPMTVFITPSKRASTLFGVKPCAGDTVLGSGACVGYFKIRDYAPNAEFILAPRGDNRNSPRYAEALEFGAIPIFIADKLFESGIPFQCLVPWRMFSLQVTEAKIMCDAAATLHDTMSAVSQDKRAVMRTLMHHFRRDVLWRATNSRVAENILLEAVRGRAGGNLLNNMTCPFVDEQRHCPDCIKLFGLDEKCRGQQCCG